jgi:ABC-type branched-subunit amino acid transport system ATPase component
MEVVGRLRLDGTSALLVEQGVAVALRHARRAYVLESLREDVSRR